MHAVTRGAAARATQQKVYCSWAFGPRTFQSILIDTGSLFPQKATTAPTRQHDKQVPQPLLRFCFWLPRFGDIHSPHAPARLLGPHRHHAAPLRCDGDAGQQDRAARGGGQRQARAVKVRLRSSLPIALVTMPSLPVSSGSSAGLAFNKATQAFHQHKAIVASSLTNASSESQHVSMATMFLVALSCIAAVGLLVYLVRCLMAMCSDDTFQKALDADRFVPLFRRVAAAVSPDFNAVFHRDAHYARYGTIPPSTSEGNRFIRDPDL